MTYSCIFVKYIILRWIYFCNLTQKVTLCHSSVFAKKVNQQNLITIKTCWGWTIITVHVSKALNAFGPHTCRKLASPSSRQHIKFPLGENTTSYTDEGCSLWAASFCSATFSRHTLPIIVCLLKNYDLKRKTHSSHRLHPTPKCCKYPCSLSSFFLNIFLPLDIFLPYLDPKSVTFWTGLQKQINLFAETDLYFLCLVGPINISPHKQYIITGSFQYFIYLTRVFKLLLKQH